jgi:hypothetical protein
MSHKTAFFASLALAAILSVIVGSQWNGLVSRGSAPEPTPTSDVIAAEEADPARPSPTSPTTGSAVSQTGLSLKVSVPAPGDARPTGSANQSAPAGDGWDDDEEDDDAYEDDDDDDHEHEDDEHEDDD